MGSSRTKRVVYSNEAVVLKELRHRNGFSMREAGKQLGYSSSYISQIENGRENSPNGERLKRFLDLYGGITEKYYRELCRDWKSTETELEQLQRLVSKLPKAKLAFVRSMVEQLLKE